MDLGVDVFAGCVTPPRYQPGTGLRPGGERPDLKALLPALYAALYDSIAAYSRHGLSVVVDIGHHEADSRPLDILPDAARRLEGLPVLFVGVHGPIEQIMQRREDSQPGMSEDYAVPGTGGTIPEPVLRWQHTVHSHHLDHGPTPTAFHRLKPPR